MMKIGQVRSATHMSGSFFSFHAGIHHEEIVPHEAEGRRFTPKAPLAPRRLCPRKSGVVVGFIVAPGRKIALLGNDAGTTRSMVPGTPRLA
ncbi:hypothetical protein [Bradyrhizobium acaciae]|uniref:hypothetical protein n=1 Tax=Bradyrhizobium acaciae TaxID=2683706 RepID=UPI001E2A3F9A|nr:hypothetical protein [Bradyrhizobium acaciae]MCC8978539.1 hypothetical protein [Bradyrhizobium acaciae]